MTTRSSTVAQIVGFVDIVLAVYVLSYLCTLFSQDVEVLNPGTHLTHTEKVTRLVVYAIFNMSGVTIQLIMAAKLLFSVRKANEENVVEMSRALKWWAEWSVIYLLLLILDASIITLLMDFSQRKLLALVTACSQILFRVISMIIVGKIKSDLEDGLYDKETV